MPRLLPVNYDSDSDLEDGGDNDDDDDNDGGGGGSGGSGDDESVENNPYRTPLQRHRVTALRELTTGLWPMYVP